MKSNLGENGKEAKSVNGEGRSRFDVESRLASRLWQRGSPKGLKLGSSSPLSSRLTANF